MRLKSASAAALLLCACDIAAVPSTVSDGLGRPAIHTRVWVDVEGLPPGVDAMVFDVSSLAIRRTRDETWLPVVTRSTSVTLSPDEPSVMLAETAVGADTYDRIEILSGGLQLERQGQAHEGDLDREDATLAVQWVFTHDVDVVIHLDYRADFDLTANSLDIVFAPLVELQ